MLGAQRIAPVNSGVVWRAPAQLESNGRARRSWVPGHRSPVAGARPIRAVISSEDKTVEGGAKAVESKDGNVLSSSSSSSSSSAKGIDVRAVITIRKKMKEKITEKIEDQWEGFMNGIGQGISIQLVSEEIDPGLFQSFFAFMGLRILLAKRVIWLLAYLVFGLLGT